MIQATHLHAMLVHFPIALLFVGFFSEILGLITKKDFFKRAGYFLLVLGAAGAVASYFSGENAGEGMEEGLLGRAIEEHEEAALYAMILAVAAAALRVLYEMMKEKKVWMYMLTFVLYTASIAAVARTGYLGGQLVYKHAAGVELTLPGFNNATPTDGDDD